MQAQEMISIGSPNYPVDSKRLANKSNGAIERDDLRRDETASG